MKKYIFIIFTCSILTVNLCMADEVMLNNGSLIQGNIIKVDKARQIIKLDVVDNGELVNAIMTLSINEVEYVVVNKEYKNLRRKDISEKDREDSRMEALSRKEKARKYELKYEQAIRNQNLSETNRQLSENVRKNNREFKLKREKEILTLRHEQRKDLIKSSKEIYVSPSLRIVDTNEQTGTVTNVTQENSGGYYE